MLKCLSGIKGQMTLMCLWLATNSKADGIFILNGERFFLQNRFSKENLFDVSIANTGCSITELPLFREADVIHLHWINQGMLSVNEIEKIIASGKKVVWTMHDMWPFTGICHHAVTCINYERSCGLCPPYLVSASPEDLSHSIFLKKNKPSTEMGKSLLWPAATGSKNLQSEVR